MNIKNFSQYHYYCPKCEAKISTNEKVSFLIHTPEGEATIFVDPVPGKYGYMIEPQVDLENGKPYPFHCPSCKKDLASDKFENFVSVIMRPTLHVEFELLFSNICGKHETYVITEDMQGKDAKHPRDLIDL